jgi:hypothetical protein
MKYKIYKIIANHCDQDCTDKKCTYCEENVEQILNLILNGIVIEKKEYLDKDQTTQQMLKSGFNQCIDELEEIKNRLKG